MFLKDVEHWLNTRPFEPFTMHLTSGERIVVRHPENCYFGKNSIFVVHAHNRHLEGFANISLYHIAKIEAGNGSPNGKAKQRRKKAQ
jgi:hypothetical protein